jgi:hypothetical protein
MSFTPWEIDALSEMIRGIVDARIVEERERLAKAIGLEAAELGCPVKAVLIDLAWRVANAANTEK